MNDNDLSATLMTLEGYTQPLIALADLFVVNETESNHIPKAILVASLRKANQQLRALTMLSHSGFLEESTAVARMLIEAIVNAIYLQTAEDSEITRFLSYDSQHINADLLIDHVARGESNAAAQIQEELAAQSLRTGIKSKALTWSAKKLHERAKVADLQTKLPVLNPLQRSIFRASNFSVHSTFLSMAHLFPEAAEKGGFPQREKLHYAALKFVELALRFFVDYSARAAGLDHAQG